MSDTNSNESKFDVSKHGLRKSQVLATAKTPKQAAWLKDYLDRLEKLHKVMREDGVKFV